MHCQACMYAAQQQDANVSLQFCTMCPNLLVLLALVLLNRQAVGTYPTLTASPSAQHCY